MLARAEAFARLVPAGIISPSQAAHLLHLPMEAEVPAYIMTRGGPVLVRDLLGGTAKEAAGG